MRDIIIGTYLLGREPMIEERVLVINDHSSFFNQWGTVVNKDGTFPFFKVKLDSGHVDWFLRFEIAWDHGH